MTVYLALGASPILAGLMGIGVMFLLVGAIAGIAVLSVYIENKWGRGDVVALSIALLFFLYFSYQIGVALFGCGE
jgi:hypothetical protein